jgi:pyoverdine/dityrosine biosynthesis protein Dit1
VNVTDEDIAAYRKSLEAMITDLGAAASIRIFGLEDAYALKSPVLAREHLLATYAMSVEDVKKRAAEEKIHAAQLDGIHRFMFEDEIGAGQSKLSRTQARKVTRERAYEVVRRSDAWGKLVDVSFPRSIRLSIHPQPDVSPKIGIPLIPTDDAWLTPWHGTLVATPDGARLMRRADAEELGAVLAEANGRPFMEIRSR